MELLDFEFEIPETMTVARTSTGTGGVCLDIGGDHAEQLLSSIFTRAIAAGFVENRREHRRVELDRGEQRLILVFDSTGLTVQVYDPTGYPVARHDGSTIFLGDLRVDCGSAAIEPLREKYVKDRYLRSGAWKIAGVSADDLVTRFIDQVVANKGLTRGPIFGPAKAGIRQSAGNC
jgi:hypothetical protein